MEAKKVGNNQLFGLAMCYGAKQFGLWHLVVAGGLLLLAVITYWQGHWSWGQLWKWNTLEPFITAATLLAAVSLWLRSLLNDWRNSLAKRLDVEFILADDRDKTMICRKVVLSHEADIRAWSQQVGKQMVFNQQLQFDLDWQQSKLGIFKGGNEVFTLYGAKFVLTKPPAVFLHHTSLREIEWEYDFNNNGFDTWGWFYENGQRMRKDWRQVEAPPSELLKG